MTCAQLLAECNTVITGWTP